jgi:hypothetical protein
MPSLLLALAPPLHLALARELRLPKLCLSPLELLMQFVGVLPQLFKLLLGRGQLQGHFVRIGLETVVFRT